MKNYTCYAVAIAFYKWRIIGGFGTVKTGGGGGGGLGNLVLTQ